MELNQRKNGSITKVEIDPTQTAVILCDMWNKHWCAAATRRCGEMAPRINALLCKMRELGSAIIHAPSDTLDFYKDYAARKRLLATPERNDLVPGDSLPLPDLGLVASDDNACYCDPVCPKVYSSWTRQSELIDIDDDKDLIGDDSKVIAYLKNNNIKHVILVGVHTNMCIIHRQFAARALAANGFNPMLVRDLTDCMYNPAMPPHIDHFAAIDHTVEFIEKHMGCSITSDQILGGAPFKFEEDKR